MRHTVIFGSMLTYCPHLEAEMTVVGTLSPFDRVLVTVMPPGMCSGSTFYSLEKHTLDCRIGG